MGRKSLAEIQTRRVDVRDMILKGKPKNHIVSFINTHYGVGLSTIENDITECYKDIREYWEARGSDAIAEHVSRYEKIYEEALDIGDQNTALKALKQKEQLTKMIAPEMQQNNYQQNNIIIDLSGYNLEELKQLL